MKILVVVILFSLTGFGVENGSPLASEWNGVSPVIRISSGERGVDFPRCSGVLVSPRVVVTAAHCFYQMAFVRRVAIEDLSTGRRHVSLFKTMVKSGYDSNFHNQTEYVDGGYDIGVLILAYDVPFSFPKVTLADVGTNLNTLVPNIWLLGAGEQRPFYSSASSLPIHRFRKLTFAGKPEFYGYKSAKADAGPCEGDSGGGIFAWENNRWILLGIQSTKLKGPKCSDSENEGFFVPIYPNIDWINAAIKSVQK